jgi:hypothetical protein
MQDGAPPRVLRIVRQPLNQTLGEQWIGRRGPVKWPAQSRPQSSGIFGVGTPTDRNSNLDTYVARKRDEEERDGREGKGQKQAEEPF